MNYLIYLGHPAHFHLFKNIIRNLQTNGHHVSILIKKKDILEDLLGRSNILYQNLLPKGRKDTKAGMAWGAIKREGKLFHYCLSKRPDLLMGTSVEIGHVGTLLKIPSIIVNEDDTSVVPMFSLTSYPWCSHILSPRVCNNGKWESKSIKYEGYHELSYLHPNHFDPSRDIVESYFNTSDPFFLIRFAKLTAHHDKGIQGINNALAMKLIDILSPRGKVYITSERDLPPELEPYRLVIDPLDIHHVIAFASLYIGDSQTMAAEAGVLGTPFVRVNDFVGRIGYLAEIEDTYELGFGIKPNQSEQLLETVRELVSTENIKEIFSIRKDKMLEEKIDVAQFMTWFVENYPESVKTMQEDPEYQYRFRS